MTSEEFYKLEEKRAMHFTLYAMYRNKHYKPNIEMLKQSCEELITMFTQKSAGQRNGNNTDGSVCWEDLERVKTTILVETLCLYLSGGLNEKK